MVGRVAQHEWAAREPLVDNGEIAVDAALEERHHGGSPGGLAKFSQEAIGTEKAVDLLVVENDPAQRLEPLVLALAAGTCRTGRRDRSGSRRTG